MSGGGRARGDGRERPGAHGVGPERRGASGGVPESGRPEGAPRAAHGPPAEGAPTGHVLVLPTRVAEAVGRGLEAAYPAEGCGVLLGRVEDGARVVERAEPAANRREDRNDRYLVDPGTLRRLLEAEDRGGPRVLGFYHSHPDAAPRPSATDRAHAWPWYVYLLVRVDGGRAADRRAWELDPAGRELVEVEVEVREGSDG